jgi:hypothetical protein
MTYSEQLVSLPVALIWCQWHIAPIYKKWNILSVVIIEEYYSYQLKHMSYPAIANNSITQTTLWRIISGFKRNISTTDILVYDDTINLLY